MTGIDCDVALLPVSGTYVMTAEEATEAARAIGPRVAVPMHYGAGVVGTASDAERFAALYGGQVFVLS
jgi:L-ascorbate metabolism protein UlaG (beta-lactamase superfamily)